MATSIGYSIGYGYPVESGDEVRIFSIFYLLSGMLGLAAVTLDFLESVLAKSKSWYDNAVAVSEMQEQNNVYLWLWAWACRHANGLRFIAVSIIIVIIAAVWHHIRFESTAVASIYFALSTVSTLGQYGPDPEDLTDSDCAISK